MGNLRRIKSEGFNEFHQNRLDEKKLLAEKKLQEEKRIIKERKRQEEINEIAERFRYNWKEEFLDTFEEWEPVVWEPVDKNQNKITRLLEVTKERAIVSCENTSEISEGMTTGALYTTTLEPSDAILVTGDPSGGIENVDGAQVVNGNIYLSHTGSQGSRTATISKTFDLSQVDYIVYRRTFISSGWENELPFASILNINNQSLGGTGVIPITGDGSEDGFEYAYLEPKHQTKNARIRVFQSISGANAQDSNYGGWIISQISFYRTSPMNVFVSLDSPEATAFIRTDPTMQGLSADERRKKLIEMLDAGDEYLLKALGLQGSKARPAEVQMPQSWEQAANNQKPTPMFDKYGRRTDTGELERGMQTTDPVGDLATLGVAAALTKAGLGGVVSQGLQAIKATDTIKKIFKPKPSGPTKAKYQSTPKPKTKDPRYKIDEPLNPSGKGHGWRGQYDQFGRKINPKTGKVLKNSYQMNGEVLAEKKKLKSPKEVIANKIPGYYDGKPAPLGFPMEPPAKTVNGFHSDLVTSDGQKKQSDRYNALDPISAKAMPPTGNPHIDKKVKAAAKKPK